MTPQKKLTLVALPALALGALAGAVLAASFAADPATAPALPTRELVELTRNLRSLTDEIAGLRQSIGGGAVSRHETAPAQTAAEERTAGPVIERLATAVEQLVAHLPGGAPGSAAASVAAAAGAVGGKRAEVLNALAGQNEDERSRAHFFWSYTQVMDRYGKPDSMYTAPDGGLNFIYQGPTPESQFGFAFHDGFVIRVWGN